MGAWIEIYNYEPVSYKVIVAPLVGAWIEIYGVIDLSKGIFVAPLVGAWIEICCQVRNCEGASSLLSWERGLKWHESELNFRLLSSLLSWERGLKSC